MPQLRDRERETIPVPDPVRETWAPPDEWFIAVIATAISLAAWLIYWRRGEVLLYGDAVAHIGIARRVLDSLTPGLGQLGTVWLPLPHLLMLPFVASLDWWRHGGGASLPSMFAYIGGSVGIFRLASRHAAPHGSNAAGWLAAAAYLANPNLIYLQATAMTEPLYLALFVWALVALAGFAQAQEAGDVPPRGAASRLLAAGALLCAAELTRYDAWFVAPFFVTTAALFWRRGRRCARPVSRLCLAGFLAMVAAGPLLWMGWNWRATGNPLDFATGTYSARGIEQRVKKTVDARAHPGEGEPLIAARYFIGAAQLTLGEKRWGRGLFWLAVGGAGLLGAGLITRRLGLSAWVLLLLWLPIPFYAYSVAYGSVPIFTPIWWPYSYYNVRYGLALLPAVAVGGGGLLAWGLARATRPAARVLVVMLAFAYLGGAYQSCWFQQPNRPQSLLPGEPWLGPIAWREAVVNARTRVPFERRLAHDLRFLPRTARLLMYTGDHVGALQWAGVPLDHVVNEGNWPAWQLGLQQPAQAADFVIAMEGDAVAAAVGRHPDGLEEVTSIRLPGQPHTVIYRSLTRRRPPPGLRAGP